MSTGQAAILKRENGLVYESGMTVFDEKLCNGRWLGRYCSANSFLERESSLQWMNEGGPASLASLDSHAFRLEIDGQSLHYGWELTGLDTTGDSSTVSLQSTLAPVKVDVCSKVDGTGFLKRWLRITNQTARPMTLQRVSPWSGVVVRVGDLHGFGSSWRDLLGSEQRTPFEVGAMVRQFCCFEGDFEWTPLPSASLRVEGRNGKSGYGTPFVVLRDNACGHHIIAGLEWSGNWFMECTCDLHTTSQAALHLHGGPAAPAPQRVLDPGETIVTPAMHIGVLQTDFDSAVQAWHRHLRASVLVVPPSQRNERVLYNTWSYREHELSEEILHHEIDVAAEIGAEAFMIDAGWYGDQNSNWADTVGDWTCGNRLANGLEPVFDYARAKGLLCGLWFDSERIGRESRIAKVHPEWRLQCHGLPTNFCDLDLTNPAAQAWMEETIVGVIERYQLDIYRLDNNTIPLEGGQSNRHGIQENSLWRHFEFLYAMYDRIRARFPNLILENCSGGGGRMDLGMMSRFHYTQITDWPVLPRAARIFNGMSLALPPECLMQFTGVAQNGHWRGDFDSCLRFGMLGLFAISGLYPDPATRNPEQIARARHHVDLYKTFIRPFLRQAEIFHHTPALPGRVPTGRCVLELAAPDRSRDLIAIFRFAADAGDDAPVIPRGLNAGKRYQVVSDNSGEVWTATGAELADSGLRARIGRALGSELFLLKEIP